MFGFSLPQILQFFGPLIPGWDQDNDADLGQCKARAEAHFRSDNYQQAERVFKKILEEHGEAITDEECCHFWIRVIDSQLRQKKIIEAISSCLTAIKKLPDIDSLYRKFVDIYIPYGDLFFQNLTQLQQYFGEQTCYVKFNRTNNDILKILFDFFDYTTKRSAIIHDLFIDIVTKSGMRDQLREFISYFLLSKVDVLTAQIELITQEVGELDEILQGPVGSQQELEALAKRIYTIKQQLIGGTDSQIPSGFGAYVQMYGKIAKNYEEHYSASVFPPLHTRFSIISASARQLIAQLLAEGHQPGICQRLQHARTLIQEPATEEDEVSTLEWIRRGNVMNYLFTRFQLPEEDATSSLTTAGICIDDLFSCDIMDQVVREYVQKPDEQTALNLFFEKNRLNTLEDLKTYIDNAKHKEIHI